jgi:Na+/melibiose symporter-like transporter
VGWAIAQVSHMSLVPALSHCQNVRVQLNSYRYGGTILANVTVLVSFLIFQYVYNDYAQSFKMLGYCVLIVGGLACFTFLNLTPEKICPHGYDPLAESLLGQHPSSSTVASRPNSQPESEILVEGEILTPPATLATDSSRLAWFSVPDFYKGNLKLLLHCMCIVFMNFKTDPFNIYS